MTTQNNTKKYSQSNINKSLISISKYAWITSSIFFSLYVYFVGAMVFSAIKKESLISETKQLVSDMSQEEVSYLNSQKNMTEEYAKSLGFIKDPNLAFSEVKRAFAWNVGR